MEVKTLEHLSTAEITEAFNAAFIDYKVKLQLTEAAMTAKIKAENIQLKYSVGVFDEGKLVGFILNAIDTIRNEKIVYNGGTGVLPAYRGKKMAENLYRFIIPKLKEQGFTKHQLEVFDDNEKAIAVYTNIGFNTTRKMFCYKGPVSKNTVEDSAVRKIALDGELFQSFWDVQPSWQNDLPSIQRNLDEHTIIGVEDNGAAVAYAIYIKKSGRVKQLAIKPAFRKRGLARQLFNYINNTVEAADIVVTCLEEDETIDNFLRRQGLEPFINMFEMHFTSP